MRRTRVAQIATVSMIGAVLVLPFTATQVGATPSSSAPSGTTADSPGLESDTLTTKWREKYEAIRKTAVEQRLRTGGSGDSERLAKGVHGRVAQTGGDRIFVVLAEFGDTRHSAFPDGGSDATTFDGPDPQRHPEAGPQDRQLHAVAGGLRPRSLRGHVLQPDEVLLRAQSSGRVHLRRRRHRVGEGAVQPGPLRPRRLRHHRVQQHLVPGPGRTRSLDRRPARRQAGPWSGSRTT